MDTKPFSPIFRTGLGTRLVFVMIECQSRHYLGTSSPLEQHTNVSLTHVT